jgi:hypothetical protein
MYGVVQCVMGWVGVGEWGIVEKVVLGHFVVDYAVVISFT